MRLYEQVWFWTGIFTLAGTLLGFFGNLIKEWITRGTRLKLERLKLHENDILKAYFKLYEFTSYASESLWPPSDPRNDFKELMRRSYFKNVKPQTLWFDSEIRQLLSTMESQYYCMSDPDLIPEKPFDDFFRNDLGNILQKVDRAVEKRTDAILHKRNKA